MIDSQPPPDADVPRVAESASSPAQLPCVARLIVRHHGLTLPLDPLQDRCVSVGSLEPAASVPELVAAMAAGRSLRLVWENTFRRRASAMVSCSLPPRIVPSPSAQPSQAHRRPFGPRQPRVDRAVRRGSGVRGRSANAGSTTHEPVWCAGRVLDVTEEKTSCGRVSTTHRSADMTRPLEPALRAMSWGAVLLAVTRAVERRG